MADRVLVQVRMDERLIQRLDDYREAQGRFLPPRSEVVTTAVAEWLDLQMSGLQRRGSVSVVTAVGTAADAEGAGTGEPDAEDDAEGEGAPDAEDASEAEEAALSRQASAQAAAASRTRADVLDLLCAWRASGRSLSWMAEELGRQQIPTFSGLPQWQPGTIGVLLKKGRAHG